MGLHKNLKLLKAAPARWLSHGEVSKRLVSRFESLADALDTLINGKAAPDIKRIRDKLLGLNIILMLLLLSDFYAHVNRFSRHLQIRNQMLMALDLLNLRCHFYSCQKKGWCYLVDYEDTNLIEAEDLLTLITEFKSNVKTPFMSDLIAELNDALKINDPVLLAFDVFNIYVNFKVK